MHPLCEPKRIRLLDHCYAYAIFQRERTIPSSRGAAHQLAFNQRTVQSPHVGCTSQNQMVGNGHSVSQPWKLRSCSALWWRC
jgi:hypothetical protein